MSGLPIMSCAESPVTTIDRTSNCHDICGKYKDCIAMDYDVNKCEDNCEAMKDSSETDKIQSCQDCVDGKSCVNSVFSCGTQCAGIVP